LIAFSLNSTNFFSQTSWDWVDGPNTIKYEAANAIVIDTINQYVYVAGVIQEAPSTYTDILSSEMNGGTDNGKKDGFVAKYDFNGNIIWSFNVGGIYDDEITGITIDPTGRIYVTGYIQGTASFYGNVAGNPGNTSMIYGGQDIFIASYLPTGALQWFRICGGPSDDQGLDICCNGTQIYATGFFTSNATFSGINTMVPYNMRNIYVFSLNISGIPLWMLDAGSDNDDYDTSLTFQQKNMGITCDDNNCYIISMMAGTNFLICNADGSFDGPIFNEDGNEDILIMAVDNTGFFVWGSQVHNYQNPVGGMDIAQDCQGLYITGCVHDLSKFPGGTIFYSDHDDGFFAQLDKVTGLEKWIIQTSGSQVFEDVGYGISTDQYGGVYVSGKYKSNPFSIGSDTTFSGAAGNEVFVAKYTNKGIYEWAVNGTGTSNDIGLDVKVYRNEDVFVCGQYTDDIFFDPISLLVTNNENIFVGRLPITPTGYPGGEDASFNYAETVYCQSYPDPAAENIITSGGTFAEMSGNIVFLDASTGLIDLSASNPGGPYTIIHKTPSPCISTYVFDIYIESDLPPVITCPSNITVGTDANICGAVVSYTPPVGTDDCTPNPVTVQSDGTGLSSGSFFSIGTTTLVYTVTDSIGQTNSCSFNITVIDDEPPALNCPVDQFRNTDTGVCTYTVVGNEFNATATDNCGLASLTNDLNGLNTLVGEVLDAGTYTITWTAVDIYSNISTCSFDLEISVTDVNATVVSCGSSYIGETTIGNGNNGSNFSCTAINTPGEDTYYQITVPPGNYKLGVTMENVSDPNDTNVMVFWVGSNCPVGTSCLDVTYYNIAAQEFQNGTNQMIYTAVGPGTYYLVIDAVNDGISSYDISFACLESGVEFDESGACPGDLNNDGVIAHINGGSNLDVAQCQTVGVCFDLFIANQLDWEWMDSVYVKLGPCYSNIVNISPNGIGTGFYRPGNWIGSYDAGNNAVIWHFDHNPPQITYGDGYSGTYSCATGEPHHYFFCFQADISSSCADDEDLNISIMISDDGFGSSGTTASSADIVQVTEINLNDPPPVFINCPSDVFLTNDPGACGVVYNFSTPAATDNCPVSTVQIAGPVSGSLFPTGTTSVIFEATDITGNTVQCSFNVTVSDNEYPVIACVANQIFSTDASSCSYTISGTGLDATATDNCGISSITNNFTGSNTLNGASFPIGITNLIWTTTDINGLTSTCSHNIQVDDNTIPSINCVSDQVFDTDPGVCTYTISGSSSIDPIPTDNCGILSLINDFNSSGTITGESFNIGTTAVLWTTVDVNGNSNTCSFNITVIDNEDPVITTCASNQTLSANAGCQATVPDLTGSITATDNCTANSSLVITQSPVAGFIIGVGTTSVIITVEDAAGNTTACNTNIIVNDDTAPVISTCASDQMLYADVSCHAMVPDLTGSITATDNCSAGSGLTITQSPIAGSVIGTGITSVTITVEDATGNTTTCNANITVNDDTDPTITTCASDQTLYADVNCQAMVLDITGGIIASDNCTANTSLVVTQNPSAGTLIGIGITIVTITVEDAAGNTATCSSNITVNDSTDPIISACALDQTIYADAGCQALVPDLTTAITATDNCTMAGNLIITQLPLAGATIGTGTTTVTITVEDEAGNTITCTAVVTVEDNENPIITCLADQLFDTDIGLCSHTIIGTILDAVSTDNCGIVSIYNSFNLDTTLSGEILPSGITAITWYATDNAGNTDTCSFNVTITDNENPVITCLPNQVIPSDFGTCTYAVSGNEFDPDTSYDSCGIDSIYNSFNSDTTLSGEILPSGSTSITWYITDHSGNVNSCSFNITVEDTIPPDISCVSDQFFNTDTGVCSYSVLGSMLDPVSTDNCGIDSIYNSFNSDTTLSGEILPSGLTVITWIATDYAGNSDTCIFNVTVSDNELPTVICPSNHIRNTDIGTCTYTVIGNEFDAISVSDNCGVSSVINSFNLSATLDGEIIGIGDTTITWTITDINGNIDSCDFIVTISDNEIPSIIAPSNIETCDTFIIYSLPVYSDNCTGAVLTQT
ncbi:MAG: HYR domain-containing protein, partial [Bacteroidota bacterium]